MYNTYNECTALYGELTTGPTIPALDITLGVISILVGLFTIILNLMIIAWFVQSGNFKQGISLLLLQVAVMDFLAGITVLTVAKYLLYGRKEVHFEGGSTFLNILEDVLLCQLCGFVLQVLCTSAPLFLAMMTFWRVVAVLYARSYALYFNIFKKVQYVLYIVGWSWGLGLAVIPYTRGSVMCYHPQWGYCDFRISKLFPKEEATLFILWLMVIPQVSSYVIIVVGSLLVSCKMLVHSTKGAEAKREGTIRHASKVVIESLPEEYTTQTTLTSPQLANRMDDKRGSQPLHRQSSLIVNMGNIRRYSREIATSIRSKTLDHGLSAKELNVIRCTLFLSINYFVTHIVWVAYNAIYVVNVGTNTFLTLSDTILGGSKSGELYIYTWFYMSHALAGLANAITQITCNHQMKTTITTGLRNVFRKCSVGTTKD